MKIFWGTCPNQIILYFTIYYNLYSKYKIQNTKYKIQNTKYKIQNTKYGFKYIDILPTSKVYQPPKLILK